MRVLYLRLPPCAYKGLWSCSRSSFIAHSSYCYTQVSLLFWSRLTLSVHRAPRSHPSIKFSNSLSSSQSSPTLSATPMMPMFSEYSPVPLKPSFSSAGNLILHPYFHLAWYVPLVLWLQSLPKSNDQKSSRTPLPLGHYNHVDRRLAHKATCKM